MMRFLTMLATVVILSAAANGTNYYVSPRGGNNASAGTSWATAWAHPNKGNGTMVSGDVMEIAPGTYDTVYINPPNSATAFTVYACSSYTTNINAGRSNTILSAGLPLTAGWTNVTGNIWRYNALFSPRWNTLQDYNVVLTQGDSLSLGGKSTLGGSFASYTSWITASGMHWYDVTNDSLFFRAFGDVDPNTVSIRASISPMFYAGSTSEGAVKIVGLGLYHAQRGPVWIGNDGMSGSSDAPDSIWILHCNVRYGGDCGPANNAGLIYGGFDSGAPPSTANAFANFIQVRACSLQYCKTPGGDYDGGGGVDTYVFSQSIFDSNYVDNCKAGGFMFKYGGGTSAGFAFANVIAFNTVVGGRAGVWAGPRQDSLMIYGNIFTGQTYMGVTIYSTGSNVPYHGRCMILNNTFVNSPGSSGYNILIAPIAESDSGMNEVKYNVASQGSTGGTIGFDVMGGEAGAQTPVTETHWVVDSNMWYRTAGSFSCRYSDNNGSCSGSSFANWQACLGGYDVHGTATTNPNLSGYSRPSASGEMNRTYGGRTWTIYGAVQNDVCPDTLVAPVFQSPSNGATGQTNSVILDWSDSTQAGTVDLYDLQVDNNSDFSSLTFSSSTPWSSDTVSATLTHLVTYYWRVRSRSDCDTSAWSGYRSLVAENYSWTMPSRQNNPLNWALDSMSTLDDHGAILVGMDAATPADGDTLAIRAGWKVIIWSADAPAAKILKDYDSTRRLIIYSSLDHGLKSISSAIDTVAPGNNWSDLTDEYSHHRKICNDSSKSYYSLFYHFNEATKILLSPRAAGGGYTYHDTVNFPACTLPISDDDSSSVIPDSYSSPYFASYGTLDTMLIDTVGLIIHRSFNYQGTPQGSRVTRVYLDFSNPLARYCELSYISRAFASNYANLGGTANDVYGWGALSAGGYHWDGIFLDNSSDQSNYSPEGMTIISGGNIRCSRGVLGKWNADSTRNKINSHAKEYFAYVTDYCNSIGKITAANFGAWNENLSSRNPITQWYNDSNRINLKVLEFSSWDGGYSTESAYESGSGSTTLGRSIAQQQQMDSLARANDFYVMYGGRVDFIDTVTSTGWAAMKQAFMRSDWTRIKTALGYRGIYAPQPLIATATTAPTPTFVYRPCSNSSGVGYAGLNYSPDCNDRSEVDTYVNLSILPYMKTYDLGKKIADSTATLTLTDGTAQTVSVYKTFWRDVVGTDTTYSYIFYFPRRLSTWEWRPSDNHYVLIDPPPVNFKRLEYDGTLTTISGAAQYCYIGNQLILSYSTATPFVESPMNTLRGTTLKGVTIK